MVKFPRRGSPAPPLVIVVLLPLIRHDVGVTSAATVDRDGAGLPESRCGREGERDQCLQGLSSRLFSLAMPPRGRK